MTEKPNGEYDDEDAADQRIEDHPASVELKGLAVPGAYAGYADGKQCCRLAPYEVAVVVYEPPLHPAVDVAQYSSPEVQHLGVDSIHEELQYD